MVNLGLDNVAEEDPLLARHSSVRHQIPVAVELQLVEDDLLPFPDILPPEHLDGAFLADDCPRGPGAALDRSSPDAEVWQRLAMREQRSRPHHRPWPVAVLDDFTGREEELSREGWVVLVHHVRYHHLVECLRREPAERRKGLFVVRPDADVPRVVDSDLAGGVCEGLDQEHLRQVPDEQLPLRHRWVSRVDSLLDPAIVHADARRKDSLGHHLGVELEPGASHCADHH
mmetsp:Transcript_38020/g.89056  ORF Transcript_38020/g.89056 Transcript_38020/m.89056 type:complete len:229 (+) Transcript_38020:953-1639(+)